MATVRPAFLRPVEITTSNNAFRVTRDAVSNNLTLTTGLYATPYSVFVSLLNTVGNDANWTLIGRFEEDGKISVTAMDTETIDIEWYNSAAEALRDLLGFNSDGSSTTAPIGSWKTAGMRPSHMWVPTFNYGDQGRWAPKHRDLFKGATSMTGALAGNYSGTTVYHRTLKFNHELATNLFESACTSSLMVDRCLDTFAKECRTAYPSASGVPAAKGFYFLEDINTLVDFGSSIYGPTSGGNYPFAENDDGGIHFDYDADGVQVSNWLGYSVTPDNYVFCNLDEKGIADASGAASLPAGLTRYNVSLKIHTAPAQDWEFTYD